MASSTNPPAAGKRRGVALPGQPTEEAVAEVGSEAGKSLVRGLSRLGSALIDGWATTKEAQAEAARLAIETQAQIDRDWALTKAQHEKELSELDHQATLRRRLDRLLRELEFEQVNLDAIESKAIEFTEADPENHKSREIDDDWLFKFADLAQRTSDQDVQVFWSRVLSSAAIEGAGQLSASALQTLSLFDKRAADDFRKFLAAQAHLGRYPTAVRGPPEPQSIDLNNLSDLGVIHEGIENEPIQLLGLGFGSPGLPTGGMTILSQQSLTKRGYEIAKAVFRHERFSLDDELEQQYLRAFLQGELKGNRGMAVFLSESGQPLQQIVTIGWKVEPPSEAWKASPAVAMFPLRLQKLLNWASGRWFIEVAGPSASTTKGRAT